MSDVGEEQTCRICRCGAEPDSPLYHPCKCIGSIQYVHSDCLLEWLNHSRKKHCELCGHAFGFHKRYSPSMPLVLPYHLYARRFVQRSLRLVVTLLRAVLVATAWLALLPLGNIYTWRGYFWAGDLIVWCVKGGKTPWGMWKHSRSAATTSASSIAIQLPDLVNAANQTKNSSEARYLAAFVVDSIEASNISQVFKVGLTSKLKHRYGAQLLSQTASNATSQWCPVKLNETFTLTCEALAKVQRSVDIIIKDWPQRITEEMQKQGISTTPTVASQSMVDALRNAVSMSKFRRFASGIARDCFEGQVLTCCVVIVFVAGFLFREWVLQNMPHRLEEMLNEPPAPAPPAAPQPAELPLAAQVMALEDAANTARRDVEAARLRVQETRRNLDQGPSDETRQELPLAAQVMALEDAANTARRDVEAARLRVQETRRNLDQGPSDETRQERENQAAQLDTTSRTGEATQIEVEEESDEVFDVAEMRARRLERFGASSSQLQHGAGAHERDKINTPRLETYIDTKYVRPYTAAATPAQNGASESIFPPTPDETPTSAVDKGKGKARELPSPPAPIEETDKPLTPAPDTPTSHVRHAALPGSSSAPGMALGEEEVANALFKRRIITDFGASSEGAAFMSQLEEHETPLTPTESDVESQQAQSDAQEVEEDDDDEEKEEAVPYSDWQTDEDEEEIVAQDGPANRGEVAEIAAALRHLQRLPDVELRVDVRELPNAPPVAIVAPLAEQPIDLGGLDVWAEDADEALGPVDNDFEGVMEAIGMQGPLINLVSNVSMMLVLCSFVLLVFVALPYVFGKLLGVKDCAQLAEFVIVGPVRLVRLVTDPFFDFVIRVMRKGAEATARAAARKLPSLLNTSGATATQRVRASSSMNFHSVTTMLARIPLPSTARTHLDKAVHSLSEQHPSLIALPTTLRQRFNVAFLALSALIERFDAKTRGVKLSDRGFCVLLGWIYGTTLVSFHSRLGARFYARSKLLEFIDQQLMLLKVVVFTVIELAMFPLGCGALLDACTMPVWKDVDVTLRWMQLKEAPFSIGFTMWLMGTLWMYVFATFVSATRSVVRPGVMCWIHDSNDPTFHPIREIVERRSFVQLRKIAISAALYAGVIIATLGCSIQAAKLLHSRGVPTLPLEWRPHEALASTPFDLLALLFLLRPAIRYIKPETIARNASQMWWIATAHELRLTSFLLGGRPRDEEGSHTRWTWRARLLFLREPIDSKGHPTGPAPPGVMFTPDLESAFARVPADDHSAPGPLLIRTDEAGIPVTAEGLRALEKQKQEEAQREADPQHAANAAEADVPLKGKFVIVYLPPNFQLRLITFLVLLWLTLCTCIVSALHIPLTIGRKMVRLTGMSPIHDLYTWVLGAAVLLLMARVYLTACDPKVRRKWTKGRLLRRSNRVRIRLRALKFARRAWIITAFGIIIPTLLGVTTEIYLVALGALHKISHPTHVPEISLSKAWAYGLLEQRLILSFLHLVPLNGALADATRLRDFVQVVFELELTGIRRPQAWHVTRSVFLPILGVLLVLLLGPILATATLTEIIGLGKGKELFWLRIAQRTVIWALITIRAHNIVFERMEGWTASLRDENFLESTVLRDYAGDEESERAVVEAERRAMLLRAGAHDRLGMDLQPEQAEQVAQAMAAENPFMGAAAFPGPDRNEEDAESEAENVIPSSNASSVASEDLTAARIDEID